MKQKQAKPFPVRMDDEVKQWVASRAKLNDRSMNAEINRLLRKLLETEGKAA